MKTCPCGSGATLNECCRRYISGSERAETPEALMRSRYTAYTMANIPYIQLTMKGKAAVGYQPESAVQWAQSVTWLGLRVLNSYMKGDDRGFVEFVAVFSHEGREQQIHELSEFQKIKGIWYYMDGTLSSEQQKRSG